MSDGSLGFITPVARAARVALILVSLAACGGAQVKSGGGRPDWVDGQSKSWSRSRYLAGVGRGDDMATAEARARGEIANIFSVQVTARTSSQSAEVDTGATGENGTSSFASTVASEVEQVSQKVLEGVEIVQRWRDPVEQTSFALAVLEREKGSAAVLSRLAAFDTQLKVWDESLRRPGATRLERVKAARRLLSLLDHRKGFEADLRILEEGAPPAPVDEAAVRKLAAEALNELVCAVSFSGVGAHEVETAVVKALIDSGMQASAGPPSGPADVVIEGKAAVIPVEGADPRWKWARSQVSVIATDAAARKVFVQLDLADKGSASDADTAQRRSLANLAGQVAIRLGFGISSYLENQ